MPNMDTFTMITTGYLAWLDGRARQAGLQRTLSNAFFKKVDDSGLHIVAHNHLLDPDTVRCTLLVKWKGQVQPVHATLDMSYPDFRELPRFTYDIHGEVTIAPRKKLSRRERKQWEAIANAINSEWEAPVAEDALSFDEVEAAGLDGTLRTM